MASEYSIPPESEWATSLETADSGQWVLACSPWGITGFAMIDRTTKTQLVVSGNNYTRSRGLGVGGGRAMRRNSVALITGAHVSAYKRATARREAERARNALDASVRRQRDRITTDQWERLHGLMAEALGVLDAE